MARIKRRPMPCRPRVYTLDPRIRLLLEKDVLQLERLMRPLVREIVDNALACGLHNRFAEHKGLGKYCSTPIEAGVLVAVYQGQVAPDTRGRSDARALLMRPIRGREYVVYGAGPSQVNAADLNHSCLKHNCRFMYVHDDPGRLNAVVVETCRRIEAGEELLLDYGESYFLAGEGSVPCRCDDPCPKGRRF